MEKLIELLKKYKSLNVIPSLEEEQAQLFEYVYTTNRLEGNQLSLLKQPIYSKVILFPEIT